MPDLLDSAPADATPTPAAGGATPDPKDAAAAGGTGLDTPKTSAAAAPTNGADGSNPTGSPDKKPVDLESAIADALSARKDADAKEAEKKAATDRAAALESELAKFKPARDLLSQGKRAEAIKAFVDQIDDGLLVDLAKLLPENPGDGGGAAEPTMQELAEAAAKKIIADEKAAAKKAEDDKKAAEDTAQAEADQRELTTYKKRAAVELKAALASGKYPFIADYGCDEASFLRLLKDGVEKTGKLPEPSELLAAVEAEHEARWKKSRFAPKPPEKEQSFEDLVAESFKEHKNDLPYTPPPDVDDERAALERMDNERRNRRDWRA